MLQGWNRHRHLPQPAGTDLDMSCKLLVYMYCFVILCLNIIVNYDLCIRLGALLPLINLNIIYHLLYTCHDSTASLLDTREDISFFYQLPECSPWSHSMSGLEMGQPWFFRRWTLGYIFAPRSSQDFPQMSNKNSDCRVCNDLQK